MANKDNIKIICKLCGKDLTDAYKKLVGTGPIDSNIFFLIHAMAHFDIKFQDMYLITEQEKEEKEEDK